MKKSIIIAVAAMLAVSVIAMPVLATDAIRSVKVADQAQNTRVTPIIQEASARIYHPSPTLEIETILLVDDDGGPNNNGTYLDIQTYYQNALTAAGYSFDDYIVDWTISNPPENGPTVVEMSAYDCVIWFTGETWGNEGTAHDVLTDDDELNLATYLTGGGTLFLNAQDYLYASYPAAGSFSPGEFPYDYLGVSSANQDYWTPPLTVAGAAGGFAEGLNYVCLNPYDPATLWTDQLTPRDQKLLNADGTQDACAVQYDGGTFYTAFSTCGMEGLVDGASTSADYIDAILSGFGAAGVDLTQEPVVVTGYLLDQNFPNPFNPSTEIRYQLPVQGNVTLTVYNVTGQEVAILINGEQAPGIYHVRWNALNQPSGMYFYQLVTDRYQDVRQMMLLK